MLQYFGGTNFGRTAGGPLIATSYDYDAPLDEYGKIFQHLGHPIDFSTMQSLSDQKFHNFITGFLRQPKWGHLRDLHKAIKLCEEYLISSDPNHQPLGHNLEVFNMFMQSKD